MLRIACVVLAALLSPMVGCRTRVDATSDQVATSGTGTGAPVFLTVDFQPGQTLRYRFVSQRNIALDWDPNAGGGGNSVQEQSERVEMVVAYVPVQVDSYGLSTIRASVESVAASRSGGPGRRGYGSDAVEAAQGKTFTLKVDPRGRIVDHSELEALIKEMGKRAFRSGPSRGRVKEPDMVGDFWASQWFLWDSVSSIEEPAAGVAVGRTWTSRLSVPTPMVMREARDVTYRLDAVHRNDTGSVAVIESADALAETAPVDWPVPYSGRFQMSGTFGFLGAYRIISLEGKGRELFNMDAGRVEIRRQQYTVQMQASLPPLGIRASPHIRIDQTLTAELLGEEGWKDGMVQ